MNNNMKVNNKNITDVITSAIFLIIIFFFAVLFFALPDKKHSDEENRSLQQIPAFNSDTLISGRFTDDIGKYYADQFPLRNIFVGMKTAVSYAFLINQNNGAVIAKDGYIIQRHDLYDGIEANFDLDLSFNETMQYIKSNCEYINIFRENLKEFGNINLIFAVAPRKIDVMVNKLPAFFPADRNQVYYNTLEENINHDIYHDLKSVLLSKNDEYIYYRTDHHWTTLGAYYAYCSLMEKLGVSKREPFYQEIYPIGKEHFLIEKVSSDFYGTTWSRAGAKWIKPDDIYYFRQEDKLEAEIFMTEIHGRKIFEGFYDFELLQAKDKYASFTGGINARTSVYLKPDAEYYPNGRGKLLLVTDSFGQSIVPFLVWHYDLEIIDLRFFNGNIYDLIIDLKISDVLILQGMESLSSQNNLVKLLTKSGG